MVLGRFSSFLTLVSTNSKWCGVVLYFHEDIPSRFLNSGSTCNIETATVEIKLRKREWLLTCCYNSHKSFSDNKTFWRTVFYVFSNKNSKNYKIIWVFSFAMISINKENKSKNKLKSAKRFRHNHRQS